VSTEVPGVFTYGPGVSRVDCVPEFPSMDANKLLRILLREPLAYRVVRQKGSHRTLVSANGYPKILYSYHREVGGSSVRDVLVRQVGLTVDEALAILRR
jgi:predicted RNA binding protein YcfA (HicA-like mRNA interferase family)